MLSKSNNHHITTHKGDIMSANVTSKDAKGIAPSLVWFEIPADNPERAKSFYASLFGWKIEKFPGATDYWHIDTGGGDDTPDGGLMKRQHPDQPITNYVAVSSVDESSAKVEKLGGKICKVKTAVPQMGYFAICRDTEGNEFALWEKEDSAK
jgi:predicted enzyme related to lactoylglutathione lyase